jgi:hypothetical protein
MLAGSVLSTTLAPDYKTQNSLLSPSLKATLPLLSHKPTSPCGLTGWGHQKATPTRAKCQLFHSPLHVATRRPCFTEN